MPPLPQHNDGGSVLQFAHGVKSAVRLTPVNLKEKYIKRASQERRYAQSSSSISARQLHTELAEIFEARVRFLDAVDAWISAEPRS
jgi:hypothetical protein